MDYSKDILFKYCKPVVNTVKRKDIIKGEAEQKQGEN